MLNLGYVKMREKKQEAGSLVCKVNWTTWVAANGDSG